MIYLTHTDSTGAKSELLRRTEYYCDFRFHRDGAFNESAISPKDFLKRLWNVPEKTET